MLYLLLPLLLTGALPAAAAEDATLITNGPVRADGRPVRWFIHSPLISDRARVWVRIDDRRVRGVEVLGDGIAQVEWIPPNDPDIADIVVGLQIRGPEGDADASIPVTLAPPRPQTLSLDTEPSAIRLGETSSVTLRLRVGVSAQDLAARRFAVRASVGTLSALKPAGDGLFEARWTAPRDLAGGQVVLFAASEQTNPDAVGAFALPIISREDRTFPVPKGSTVTLVQEGARQGPYAASPDGTIAFSNVIIDPRTPEAILELARNGEKQQQTAPLLSEPLQLALIAPLPASAPRDPSATVPAHVVSWPRAQAPTVTVNDSPLAATLGPHGAWTADVPLAVDVDTLQVTAGYGDTIDQGSLSVTRPASATLSLTPEPLAFDAETRRISLTTQVTPAGPPPRLSAVGARLGDPKDMSQGVFVTDAERTGDGTVLAVALPEPAALGAVPARLIAWTDAAALDTDEKTLLMVVVTDALGQPIPNTRLQLSARGATVPETAKTGPGGVAWVPLTQTSDTLAQVRIAGAGLWDEVTVITGENTTPLIAGTEAERAEERRWRDRTAAAVIPPAPPPEPLPESVAATPAPTSPEAAGEDPPEASVAAAEAEAPGEARTRRRKPRPASQAPHRGIRLSVGLGGGTHGYSSTGTGGRLTESAAFDTGSLLSFPTLEGRAGWSARRWGVDLRARFWSEQLDVDGDTQGSDALEYAVGGRYYHPLLPILTAYGVGQVHALSTPIFRFADETFTNLATSRLEQTGLRIGAGLVAGAGPAWLRLEVAETFAWLPASHQAEGELAINVSRQFSVRALYQIEARRLRGEAFGGDVDVQDDLMMLTVGATWRIPTP